MSKQEIELMDEKFKGLTTLMNAQFTNIHERLDEIKEQTLKTNGRVTELEKLSNLHTLSINTQQMNCPNTKKIENMETNMQDVNFFIRHPKLFIAGMAIVVFLTIATFINNNPFKVFEKTKTPVQTELVK